MVPRIAIRLGFDILIVNRVTMGLNYNRTQSISSDILIMEGKFAKADKSSTSNNWMKNSENFAEFS